MSEDSVQSTCPAGQPHNIHQKKGGRGKPMAHCLCRYASLFNSYVGLLSAAEESRPLLMLGMGARGMGPLRAALEWTPIQAHATANAVSLFYVTESQQSAAYLADWDSWRQAGVSC